MTSPPVKQKNVDASGKQEIKSAGLGDGLLWERYMSKITPSFLTSMAKWMMLQDQEVEHAGRMKITSLI